MKILKISILLSLSFFVIPNALVAGIDAVCSGENTIIYSNKDMTLTICHAPYTKISQTQLDQWQDCDDAIIRISNKKKGKTTEYIDCGLSSNIQFMLRGDTFMLRHYFTEYPGFEMKPMLIESLDLASNKNTYEFITEFPTCSKKEIGQTIQVIDSTIAAPFDGKTYFKSIYSSFFRLRDCAKDDYGYVLSVLRKYQESGAFDGEVAETLVSVIDEVELIALATK